MDKGEGEGSKFFVTKSVLTKKSEREQKSILTKKSGRET